MQTLPALPHLRGVTEWRAMGIPLSTTSDEAAKMLDAYFYQTYGMYQAKELGGLEKTFQRLTEADPDFCITKIIALDQKVGYRRSNWAPLSKETANLCQDLESRLPIVNEWEKRHIEAMLAKVNGCHSRAAKLWEDNLAAVPSDLFAGHQMFEHALHWGGQTYMCYAFGLLSQNASASDPFLGFYQSRLGFGLSERGLHEEARLWLDKSLHNINWDPWGHHSYAHLDDSLALHTLGLERLLNHRKDWDLVDNHSFLQGHNYWHVALLAWAVGDEEKLMQVLDDVLLPRVTKMQPEAINLLSLVDAISILMRIELEELLPQNELQQRWDLINEMIERCNLDDGGVGHPFYDAHVAMSLLASRKPEKYQAYVNTLKVQCEELYEAVNNHRKGSIENDSGLLLDKESPDLIVIMSSVNINLMKGLAAFTNGEYEKAAELLYASRRKFPTIGGSNAQRDVFLLTLYHSLGRSGTLLNISRLKSLLAEQRLFFQSKCDPLERLSARFQLTHPTEAGLHNQDLLG